jgi:hypothetical protein
MLGELIALMLVVKDAAILIEVTAEVLAIINDILDLLGGLTEPAYSDLSLEQRTEVLKRCTKIIANLDLDLSCYPLGYETTILFDLDGNPVP